MADVLKKGELFAPETVTDLFNKVAGKSSLAKLAGTMPIPFNGSEIFTFSMDDEVNIVAENGVKPAGSIALAPIKVVPIKIEYGARVTDEFMFATEEKQLDILKAFNEGYAKKVARAIDIMAMHGLNPRTKEKSALIGTNSFDTNESITKITYDEALIEDNIETAIAAVNEAYDVTGMAMSKTFSSSLAKLKVNGVKQYPELAWGANPGSVNGLSVDVNSTVSFNNSKDKAIVGDFANAFKWGYAKEIPLEIIPYGDPDQSGKDLKANGQIYLRCETYIGWGILDPTAFSRIEAAE
ncbi:MAG: phage capsid protein [Clostridiales bacterium 36_14]|nr:MAG: phage capsid protein [Clostridiales bacterium 36_14]DAS27741.1 MAG TPA: major capsid protein [Caudoviricetes sp.]